MNCKSLTTVALVALLAGIVACAPPPTEWTQAEAAAECDASEKETPSDPTNANRWRLRFGSQFNGDGRHVLVAWARCHNPSGHLLVMRRGATPEDAARQAPQLVTIGEPGMPSAIAGAFLRGQGLELAAQQVAPPPAPMGPETPEARQQRLRAAVVELLTPMIFPDHLPLLTTADGSGALTLQEGSEVGLWTVVKRVEASESKKPTTFIDEVAPDKKYVYALVSLQPGPSEGTYIGFPEHAVILPTVAAKPYWFHTGRWFFLTLVLLVAAAFFLYIWIARRAGDKLFVRRIAAIDAIEDAVGRSTEMGRPVLYVTGLEEIQDIQTIASLLILGHVSEMTATYDTELKVANTYPLTMVVAEEIVRQGHANAGRLDSHRPENVFFVTSEQFAFAAAVNGIILRDKPATNIYLGRFFAESLLLAETGFVTGAVQIAGTAEFTQLPFFVAACDYTLIGEELYATSAYLTREPTLLAQLKAGDVVKALAVALILTSVALATWGSFNLPKWLMP